MTPIDYVSLSEYAKSWPDSLIAFFCEHCADDEYRTFVADYWDERQEGDRNGPAIKEWWDE